MASPCITLDAVFERAVASFEASLTDKQRREFRGCSLQEVQDTIVGIESRLASQRRQCSMRRIAKFLEGMEQLGKVIEIFVNCDSMVAFVWGPIKFVLLAAGTLVETLDRLLDTYAEIGDFLPTLSQCGSLLAQHPALSIHLQKYYCDVLDFHSKALAVFSRPSWKVAFHSAWKTFQTQFTPILTKLKRHRDLLSNEKLTAAIANVHHSVHAVEDKVDEVSRQLQRLYLIDDEELSRRHREDLDRKRQFVLSKLDPPDYQYDLERASNKRRDSVSGDWLLGDNTFKEWADMTSMQPRALYLAGIPGTGKTILTSRVVQYFHQLRATTNTKSLPLYFLFKHHQPEKRTFVAMLLSLLAQAVFQDEVLLDLVYQRCIGADQLKIRSASLLRELAELVLKAQSRWFVVIDALDECARDQSLTAEDAQSRIIDWLESVMKAPDVREQEASSQSEPRERCIRVFISGQRNGLLEERLRHWPTIHLDQSLSHMSDIKSYSESESIQIQQKFKIGENARLDIVSRVNSRAKGMFLYAKVVLSNLLNQPTRAHFRRELEQDNFPKDIDQAYERVAVHILGGPDEGRSALARRILNLVLCAERPLFWREIQSHFCIDVDSGTADPDFRLLEPCKKYCGSLVEVGEKEQPGLQGSGRPDDLVEVVHETARLYLVQNSGFHLVDLHAEMAVFCARYLSSTGFDPDMTEPTITAHCMTGYYGFLDYAVANWWKHARQIGASGDAPLAPWRALVKLADSLGAQHAISASIKADDMEAVMILIHQLADDGRDWEQAFPIEGRIKPIRHVLESLLGQGQGQDSTDLQDLVELYGQVTYKCSKPWCHFFLAGFKTAAERDDHVRQHERPFKCGSEGCYGFQLGFAKESELTRHNKRVHSEALSVHSEAIPIRFPSDIPSDIFEAAGKGDLDTVIELVSLGTSVDIKDKNESTPLFLAARTGQYQVCRWLLEHGANADIRCLDAKVTAAWAAVANDDAEIARLLLVDYRAALGVRSRVTGQTVFDVVRCNPCNRLRDSFPPGFWPPYEPSHVTLGNSSPSALSERATGTESSGNDEDSGAIARLRVLHAEAARLSNLEATLEIEISMSAAGLKETCQKLLKASFLAQQMRERLVTWYRHTQDDSRARMFSKMYRKVLRQFRDRQSTQIRKALTISEDELNQFSGMVEGMLQDMEVLKRKIEDAGPTMGESSFEGDKDGQTPTDFSSPLLVTDVEHSLDESNKHPSKPFSSDGAGPSPFGLANLAHPEPHATFPPLEPMTSLGHLSYGEASGSTTPIQVNINGVIDKGFFLADEEWTCYRRNFFACACSFSLTPIIHRTPIHFMPTASTETYDVHGFAMCISAIVLNVDGLKVNLVQYTLKREGVLITTPQKVRLSAKPLQVPNNHILENPYVNHGSSPGLSTESQSSVQSKENIPPTDYTFERIRLAQPAASNGKKAARECIRLIFELWAKVGQQGMEGAWVKIAYRRSTKLTMRGRSA